MFYSRSYSLSSRIPAIATGLLFMMVTLLHGAMAAEPKPLPFREVARSDTRVLTDQGKAFLSEKIRANAYSDEVMNVSWDEDRKKLKKPTIYETTHDGQRFLFVLAGNYQRIVMEVPHDKNNKRFNVIAFPGVDWVEFLHQDPHHQIDTSGFVAPREYMLRYSASGMMFRVGINEHLIVEDQVESGSTAGSVPVNITLKAGPGNRLRAQTKQLSDDGELTLVLYDSNDGEREVFNVRVNGDNHEATMEFEIPADRPMPQQTSIFELEAWQALP